MLAPMRYKNYTWPHNPESYQVVWQRPCVVHKIPLGGWYVQQLGTTARVIQGEGVFYGPEAYAQFRELEELFRQEDAGLLVHPAWPAVRAWFTQLELLQEPMPNYVTYRFAFREENTDSKGDAAQSKSNEPGYQVVSEGQSFWTIASDNGLSCAQLLALNPQLPSPNDLKVGDQIRIW